MIGNSGVDKGDSVFKLGVGEVDKGVLFELRGGNFCGLGVERVDGGRPWRG